ncbi:MAG: alpha/beta hydrolase [Leptospiraceae bacterium]|nr:MAG: alpha/beta hydrolase [Leptospiraceae bacterium]
MKKKNYFWIVYLLIFSMIYSCTSMQKIEIEKILNQRIKDPMIDSKEINIYIITNRITTTNREDCNNQFFRNAPSSVKYILCSVNVPKEHSIGALDTSSDNSLNKDKFFFARNYRSLTKEDFYKQITQEQEILIFVHGFNVEFEEALYRIAQIHYDLKFQGTSVLYTWPAGPEEGLFSSILINDTYKNNQEHAKVSIPIFKNFIEEIFQQIDNKKKNIYLIVHSMGHQIVIPSLIEISKIKYNNIKFKEIIFNAPDYPVDTFREEVNIISSLANRITIYCSPDDNALKASETVNGTRRIGQCYKVNGIDVINVQRVDSPILGIGGLGHGYYSSRAILTDLYQLMLGLEAKNRLFIIKSNQSTEDYILRD